MQKAWEGPYKIVKRINDVIYRIRKAPNGKPRVVHFNRLAPYNGDNNDQQEVRTLKDELRPSFDEFMEAYGGTGKARNGITSEEQKDLFCMPGEYSLVHCTSVDLDSRRGIARVFNKKFGRNNDLLSQQPDVGKTLQLRDGHRFLFYLITRRRMDQQSSYRNIWEALWNLRRQLLELNICKLAMPKIDCGKDGLNWRIIRNMLEVVFKDTGVNIVVCSYNPWKMPRENRTVACYFYATTGRCKEGSACRYKHGDEGMTSFRDGMDFKEGAMWRNRLRHLADARGNSVAVSS